MTSTQISVTPRATVRPLKVAGASLIGTAFEWYDYFIYGMAAAIVFGPLFFPSFSSIAGTLAAFATFSVGFIARPIGGVVVGHFGDRIGRKSMLVLSLMLMGGAVLMAVEHAPADKKGFYGSFPQMGVPGGLILANLVFLGVSTSLSEDAFLSWGWRVPFLASAAMVLMGLVIRFTVTESPHFEKVKSTHRDQRLPIVTVLRENLREVLLAAGAFIGINTVGYIFMAYLLSYSTKVLGMSKTLVLVFTLIASFVWLIVIPVASMLSDRSTSPRSHCSACSASSRSRGRSAARCDQGDAKPSGDTPPDGSVTGLHTVSGIRKAHHVHRFRARARDRRRGFPERGERRQARCPHRRPDRRRPARRQPRPRHRVAHPPGPARAQGDLLPWPGTSDRRLAVRVRGASGFPHHGASDRHVARHQGAAHRLRLRQGQQLAHRRHVRRSHPEGVDPARRATPHVRRIHHLGVGCRRLQRAARAAEGPRRQPVGDAHQRLRLRGDQRGTHAGREVEGVPRRVPVHVLRDGASGGAGAPRDRRAHAAARSLRQEPGRSEQHPVAGALPGSAGSRDLARVHDPVELAVGRRGDLGQPCHSALRRRRLRRSVPATQPHHPGRRRPRQHPGRAQPQRRRRRKWLLRHRRALTCRHDLFT
ncbi:metabolite transporter, MFS superfamily protein [Rhodococcus jostii RHA1]|uniref:Metabolite transporter, MFS superfamily protein n=1 Tax=Rhodococcus jostii (strain RHA1) TaxID=101510 RepID=Q0SEZ7_RHOJR|nr:metabolite transporter, MFS superfamily protein [Rhodococcus jostii RHA1]